MAIIVVLNKENLATLHNTDTQWVALNQASIVQLSHSREDISNIVRSGHQLIITLKNGQKITLEQFFHADGSTAHSLVLPEQNGTFNVVEFDQKGKVIDYNPIQYLNQLASGQTWLNPQPSTVVAQEPMEKTAWYDKSWVKPALVVLGVEAIYLTAFDDDNSTDQVKDTTAPTAPSASIDAQGQVVTGKTEAKAKVYVQDLQGNLLGETTADASGNYSVQLKRDVTDGETVAVYAKDAAGNQSNLVAVKGEKDTIAPQAVEAQFNDAGSIVSGRAEAGTQVRLYSADGKTVLAGPVTAGSDGSFAISVNPPLTTNTAAKVISQDAAGHLSVDTIVIVGQDTLAPAQPTLEVNSVGTQIKGYAEANSSIEIQDEHGQVITSTTANAEGYFEIQLTAALTDASTAQLVVKDAAGNSSDALSLKPKLDTLAPEAAKTTINAEGTQVTGTAEPNSKIKISIISNGQESTIGSGQADSTGQFSINLTQPLINNSIANLYVIDAANNQSVASQVIGRKDTIAPSKINLNTLSVHDGVGDKTGNLSQNAQTDDARPKFEGRAEANATLTIYDQGIAVTTVKVKSDGTWSYTPDAELALGSHQFSFTQMDQSGNTSAMSDTFKLNIVPVVQPTVASLDFDTLSLDFVTQESSFFYTTTQSLVLEQPQDNSIEPILATLLGGAEALSSTSVLIEPVVLTTTFKQDDWLQAYSYI
ncbi:Ig-like domain-containing protein [uncultured Acinetobacter sp.]|uniref:Ig-like domain-containing protein n=1 Tax=uncultured Acinetobacter sp. TaxID=165433 RepID=UPI0026321710|nr:Ig-like domain-containing protein [uncultured Acinetobacter sp.]